MRSWLRLGPPSTRYDAWVNGAEDPTSGAVALMETGRGLAELLKTGWRPKRTIILALWDGVRGQPRRSTAIAGGVVVVATAIYISNNHVCPLTPLAEDLGAARGSVVDIFLPAWAASRIPIVAGSAALLALILNVRALRARPAGRSNDVAPR